jgi:DNA-binding SARP family transcriptional activator
MEFRVLGSLEVVDGSAEVTPSAAKVRGVLAMLVLRHNQIVSTREFIDELWGERPPPSALSTLQTYVYKLRKTLGSGGTETLTTKPYGYLLEISPENVDSFRFERLTAEGRGALERGDHEHAATTLRQALGLWRGPALANLTAGELLSAQITRLEESRLRALELRIEAELRLGRHRELISELKELIAVHPLHEDFYAQLMTALHQAGRRYEALEVYQSLRRTLVDQLGLEPSPSLAHLQQRILTADPTLTHPGQEAPSPHPGQEVSAAPRTGQEVPAAFPPASSGPDQANGAEPAHPRPAHPMPDDAPERAERVPAQLPPDIGDFTGRRDVADRLVELLARPGGTAVRVVCLSGMPGVGKTALAVHVAHRIRGAFPGGQLYAELRGSTDAPADPRDVLAGFLRATGLPPGQVPAERDERGKLFRTRTSDRPTLVVLDDAGGVAQLQPLLPGSAGCVVIVTGRAGLHGFAGVEVLHLDPLGEDECLRLLAGIIGGARLEGERDAAERIVDLCGRLPLAVRCAASRLAAYPGLPLRGFADRLADPRTRLDDLAMHAAPHVDVRSALASAYDRLGEPERSTLRLLSLLRTPFVTAPQVAALLGTDVDRADRVLARLAESSLLRVEPGPAPEPCYTLHTLIRLFARERLEAELDAVPSTQAVALPDPAPRHPLLGVLNPRLP